MIKYVAIFLFVGQLFLIARAQTKGGPLSLIYDKLNKDQKHELDAIVASNGNGTKAGNYFN